MNRREFLFPGTAGRNRLVAGNEPLETASNDLTPYAGPWDDARLRHLLRRSMFGVPPAQFQAAKALGSMSAIVDKLLEASDVSKFPLPAQGGAWMTDYLVVDRTDPKSGPNEGRLDAARGQQLANWWFDLMMKENLSIREKMTLFWSNHFVTGSQTVNRTGFMYTYLQTCRRNSLGNFKQFALDISTDPAMLVYLNGTQNYVTYPKGVMKSAINENYARELMELFTLGLIDPKSGAPNYTETDIQESARALTGWQLANLNKNPTAPFAGILWDGSNGNPNWHDTGSKTFLGQTGNFGLTDVIDIIFKQGTPAGYTPAYFICQALYQNFVYYIPNSGVVDAMATVMLQNNFEIAPVMRALLSSDHFYDANVIGAQLKSPAEYLGSLVREFGLTYPAWVSNDPPLKGVDANGYNTYSDTNPTLTLITISLMTNSQGQQLLNPPNVKGWQGGHNWISTGTFQGREQYSNAILNNLYVNPKQNYNLSFSADLYAQQIPNATTLTSAALSQALEDTSLAFTLGPIESGDLKKDISKTYPDPNYKYNAADVKGFALYLASLPEFQLI